MNAFERAYKKLKALEVGYVFSKTDRGGQTYNGIARNHHPDWEGWEVIDAALAAGLDVMNLPELQVMERRFYRAKFWAPMGLDHIKVPEVTDEVFEAGVNCGATTATRWLQEAYNLCNQNGKIGRDLNVDGVIGPVTAKAINGFPAKRLDVLLKVLNLLQGERYLAICREDRTQEAHLHGWVRNRIVL